MQKIDKIVEKTLYYFCGFLMLLMVTVVTAQVISRYIFGSPFSWTEETGRYTFVWMSFLGMAVGIKHGAHIALDLLVKKLSGVSQKTLQLLINLLVAFFGGCMTYSGFLLVELGSGQTSPSLGLPMEVVYFVIPVSGILVIYFVISNMIQDFKGKENGA